MVLGVLFVKKKNLEKEGKAEDSAYAYMTINFFNFDNN